MHQIHHHSLGLGAVAFLSGVPVVPFDLGEFEELHQPWGDWPVPDWEMFCNYQDSHKNFELL